MSHDPLSIAATIDSCSEQLTAVSESARLDAELLLALAIDMPRSYLYAHPEDTLDTAAIERLDATIKRRLAGEPLAYITGMKEFWSQQLLVTPATLVPRPETERLVEIALQAIPADADWNILDLGTGSGAIACAIAGERPRCNITAVDVSAAALAVAEHNVRALQLVNVHCVEGNWTEPVAADTFKIIVSNPPYVDKDDPAMAALAAEPELALVAADGGLAAIRQLATDCRDIIDAGGWLLLEHGAEQRMAVRDLLAESGWHEIECHRDYAGRDRLTAARPAAGQS